jgi:class 3 adenylate cyclase
MVRRMQLTAEPVIETHGGTVVRFEADNCFAMFDDSLSAVRCGIGLNLAFDAANIITPIELDIHVSVGIDKGKVLVVDRYLEFFGNPVNCASKLGEDGAQPGEILITKEVADGLPAGAQIDLKPLKMALSGIEIEGYSVQYRKAPSV